ncbi:loganic acid O-methyltransferase-like [Salvia miltiorrhiza]|uniref:loganic acid O-methyltransferase-like n=1 Tax=Salvia miltiorrhiza TaxID=226208 RepID=UPI0025AD49B5|nr:loganic acid O-methyltransferase-like [Salvia miltiorrhiza]
MGESCPMNGGDGTYSYAKNSTGQRDVARAVEDAIKEAVMDNLDLDKLLCGSTRFAVADLGCSVGPNTFYSMESIIKTVQQKSSTNNLEFQVLFNDQIGNDFNTLFASLPQGRSYFAAAVAGSFHGRLFPSSSIHIAYSSVAMHWLSKLPEGVAVKGSPAWNAGKIHYMGASDAVVKAYADRFEEDMEIFLRARAQEIVAGGMVVTLLPGVPNPDIQHYAAVALNFLESILIDMVKEGVLAQEEMESFNVPSFFTCIDDMRRVVEKNGSFEIVKMEMVDLAINADAETLVRHLRASTEGTMVKHFGKEIVEQVFERAMQQKLHFTRILDSMGDKVFAGMLFAVLNRK